MVPFLIVLVISLSFLLQSLNAPVIYFFLKCFKKFLNYGLSLETPNRVLHLTGDLTLQLIALVTQIIQWEGLSLCVGCLQLGMGSFVRAL